MRKTQHILEDGLLKIPEYFLSKYKLYPGAVVIVEELHDKYTTLDGIAITPIDDDNI